MRVGTTTHTSLDTLNKQPQPDQIKGNNELIRLDISITNNS